MKRGFLMGILAGALLATPPAPVVAQGMGGQQAKAANDLTERTLGTIRLTRNVMANGELLRAGTYQVRLTADVAKPEAPGTEPTFSRWVEFVQRGEVRGREVASVVPPGEIGEVATSPRPPTGGHRVELLKGGDYVRVWINHAGTHYLIHMPPA